MKCVVCNDKYAAISWNYYPSPDDPKKWICEQCRNELLYKLYKEKNARIKEREERMKRWLENMTPEERKEYEELRERVKMLLELKHPPKPQALK